MTDEGGRFAGPFSMRFKAPLIFLAIWQALALLGSLAQAAPAPWFKYQSLATGRYICVQVDPGKYYRKFAGPYSNAGCRP